MSIAVRITVSLVISIVLVAAILYAIAFWNTRDSGVAPPKGTTLRSVSVLFGEPIQEISCSDAAHKYKVTEYGTFAEGCQRVLVFESRVYDGGLIMGSWWTELHIIAFDSAGASTSHASVLK